MQLATPPIVAAIAIALHMTFAFALCVRARNYGLVDIAWGSGFVVVALATVLFAHGGRSTTSIAVDGLVAVWGLRLSWHLARRNIGHAEDFRYAAMRAQWGDSHVWRAAYRIFGTQGLVMWLIAAPIWLAAHGAEARHGSWFILATVALGSLITVEGLALESVADRQLAVFKADPDPGKGRFLTTGVWSWCRHPNYLGEAIVWWGIALVANPARYGFLALGSAALITWFLRYVSGVPPLEDRWSTHPEWQTWASKVPPLLPWPRPRPKA